MNPVSMIVGNTPIGTALTWAYPNGNPADKIYVIPTYHLIVKGQNKNGRQTERKFEIFRFGVWKKTANSKPMVVGLADMQTHIIKRWLPDYQVHSATTNENGAWQVYDNFLIHDGPDRPMSKRSVYASIGCLAICGGPEGFSTFNDYIIELANPGKLSRREQLSKIGSSGILRIQYLKSSRPELTVAA